MSIDELVGWGDSILYCFWVLIKLNPSLLVLHDLSYWLSQVSYWKFWKYLILILIHFTDLIDLSFCLVIERSSFLYSRLVLKGHSSFPYSFVRTSKFFLFDLRIVLLSVRRSFYSLKSLCSCVMLDGRRSELLVGLDRPNDRSSEKVSLRIPVGSVNSFVVHDKACFEETFLRVDLLKVHSFLWN